MTSPIKVRRSTTRKGRRREHCWRWSGGSAVTLRGNPVAPGGEPTRAVVRTGLLSRAGACTHLHFLPRRIDQFFSHATINAMMLAEVMRAWRWHNELTLERAAAKVGISVEDYNRLETGGFTNREVTWFITRWLMGRDHPLRDLFYGPLKPPKRHRISPTPRTALRDRDMPPEASGSGT